MDSQKKMLERAKNMLIDVENLKIEDISLNVSNYDDGSKRLSIEVDYFEDKMFVQTKDGGIWVDN